EKGRLPCGRDAACYCLLELGARAACVTADEDAAASGPERRGLPESLDEIRREFGPRDPADTVRTEVAAPHGARSYLFENCGALRALCRPAFLRSTMRASRVRKPCRLRGILISGSASTSARAMPCLIAPA